MVRVPVPVLRHFLGLVGRNSASDGSRKKIYGELMARPSGWLTATFCVYSQTDPRRQTSASYPIHSPTSSTHVRFHRFSCTQPHPAKQTEFATRKVLHNPVNAKPGHANPNRDRKNGGGGKGTWGKMGDDYSSSQHVYDPKDPLYDPEADGRGLVLKASQ